MKRHWLDRLRHVASPAWIYLLVLLALFCAASIAYNASWLTQFLTIVPPGIYGIFAVMLLYGTASLVKGSINPLVIVRGVDGRSSTSQFQFCVWTVVVAFGYAAYFAARIQYFAHHPSLGSAISSLLDDFPQNVLIAMGFSATTLAGAKGITVGYIRSGSIEKNPGPKGGLLSNDDGQPDLTKIQMLFWTFIASILFLYQVGAATTTVNIMCLPTATTHCLPDISGALMALMGLGHGAYLGNKLVSTDTVGSGSGPNATVVDRANPKPAPSSVPWEHQYGTWLCWAACARMAGEALGVNPPTQCQLAHDSTQYASFPPVNPTANCLDAHGQCSQPVPSACDYILNPDRLPDIYAAIGITAVPQNPPSNAQVLQEQLKSGPLQLVFGWTNGGGHVALITYYDDVGQWFQVNDPLYGIVYPDFEDLMGAYGWGSLNIYYALAKAS